MLLEATGTGVAHEQVATLLPAVAAGAEAVVLRAEDRCALQVRVRASNPSEALSQVFSRCAEAVSHLELEGWDVVRAEVLTPDEFESDFERAERLALERLPPGASPPDGSGMRVRVPSRGLGTSQAERDGPTATSQSR